MKTAPVVILSAVVVFALAGCGLLPKAPPPVPTPTASATETSTPTPTPVAPEPRSASTPLDAWDAYLACRQLTPSFFFTPDSGDFAAVVYASFDKSVVHERPDGLWYVYSEVENGNVTADLASFSAANCIIGGTLGKPRYELFGATVRLSPGEIAAASDAPLATD